MRQGGEPKMGSTIVRGEVEATVRYTGINTFFGKTADLLNVKKGLDHLQKTLLTIVFVLTILSIALCLTCFIYIWVKCGSVLCPHACRKSTAAGMSHVASRHALSWGY